MSRSAIGMMLFGLAATLGGSLSLQVEERADAQPHRPAAAELSREETPGKAFMRQWRDQEYEVRSVAEAMPADKWDYRPAARMFENENPEFGLAEVRTFAEQVKHVACSNFAFAAELDGNKPPQACAKGGPSPAHTPAELLVYLRDSFAALAKSLSAMNMYDPSKALTRAPTPASAWPPYAFGMPRIITGGWRFTCV